VEGVNDMDGILKIYRYFEYMKLAGVWISGISLIGMMLFIVFDVFLRNVLSDSINGGFEIVQNYFMPIVVFPSLAYAYSSGVLPRMDLFMERLKDKSKMMLIFGMLILEIFILFLMTLYTWEYAMTGLERKMSFPAAGSLYPVYGLFFLIPISFTLIIIENIFILLKNVMVKKPSLLFQKDLANND
jgi:TRAP-type mannitol/chloroaromatic compound transport system permease small subunit